MQNEEKRSDIGSITDSQLNSKGETNPVGDLSIKAGFDVAAMANERASCDPKGDSFPAGSGPIGYADTEKGK